jgi:polysaccharide biosynthesis transport protein
MPSKKLRAKHQLVMLDDPASPQAEMFRMLRTNLDFSTLGDDAKVLMVTSAAQEEGKSTTIANLAIAMARAGRRVVLVDLDLRRPFLGKFFNLDGPGVTNVALGHTSLDKALATVTLTDDEQQPARASKKNGNGQVATDAVKGILRVLPSGPIPPDPGEFVGNAALTDILDQLRDRADIVLIDAPPMLRVGDAMTLSASVDGILIVTRMNVVRRPMLNELSRQLSTVPTRVLGFILTGAGTGEDEDYGYGYGHGSYSREPDAKAAKGTSTGSAV